MNADFLMSQLRVALVATVAYLSGKGVFTPADATFATAIIGAGLPILAPWLASMYATYGTVKVGTNTVAAQVAQTEKITADPDALKAAVDIATNNP